MNEGDKVKVFFEMTITSIHENKECPDRAFICGNVFLGGVHESHTKFPDLIKEAYVSGIPISRVVPIEAE
jgi:hypothetical protein